MTLDDFARDICTPGIEFRPELRWWLAEGLHTDETLHHEIETAHGFGFGGMEFLAMDEEGIDHARYGWGSEEWVHDSLVVVEQTTKRDMSVSFTSGTNWSNANIPGIDPEHPAAAQELDVIAETLAGGSSRSGALSRIDLDGPLAESPLPGERAKLRGQTFVAAVAVRVVEETGAGAVLDADSAVDLTGRAAGESLDWTAPAEGTWRLYAFWMHGTGQTASPSASVNYTVNYLERAGVDAVVDYWDTVVLTPELREQIARNPRTQMYMDSLELTTHGAGGMFWGAGVAEEFRRRRGYDIAPWLPFLTRSAPFMASSTVYVNEPLEAQAITVDKVRFDYVRTLTDLYIENMLRPFAAYLHSVGISLRSEISYGLPFELTRPGPEVDGIENESLEFAAQIDAYRLLAGPAHLFGKQYSSETGATTRNHILDHRFYDQIIATQLAAGITKTVLHGWASPAGVEGTEWPGHEGMWPMFSERFDTRQPGSAFYRLWNDAVGRYQFALRQGRPRIDVGILRTDHFTENRLGMAFYDEEGTRHPDEEYYARKWMRDRKNFWWQDLGMQDSGWTYEFFDGSLLRRDDVSFEDGLVQPGGPGYQALIVYQTALDADDAAHLLGWAKRGLRLLFVDDTRELRSILPTEVDLAHPVAAARTPGLDGRDDELAATIAELLQQPTVARIGDPAQTVDALRALGVTGRAEFTAPDQNVLSHLRDDGDLAHLYLYHFLYETGEPTRVEVALAGEGAVLRLDAWSGELRPHRGVRVEGGRTLVTVELAPGETALLTLDRSAPPAAASAPAVRTPVAAVEDWSIAVDSWDAGGEQVIEEDRGTGHVTREVRPLTAVSRLVSGTTSLAPWKDLEGVGPEVSGVGEYTAVITVDDLDTGGGARYLLELGSVGGGLGSVTVGGGDAIGFDTSVPVVDVTDALRPGENTVVVRVSSSLNNRLLARGYYEHVPDIIAEVFGGGHALQHTEVHDHGLLGPVRLVRVAAS